MYPLTYFSAICWHRLLLERKSFEEISSALLDHFEPKRSVIAERFHCHNREQAVDETIADFDAALRKLATHCQFGETLEDALLDRFVCGLRYDAIQRRLLSETTLTYPKALEIAKGMEAADKNAKAFRKTEPALLQSRNLGDTHRNSLNREVVIDVGVQTTVPSNVALRMHRSDPSIGSWTDNE